MNAYSTVTYCFFFCCLLVISVPISINQLIKISKIFPNTFQYYEGILASVLTLTEQVN